MQKLYKCFIYNQNCIGYPFDRLYMKIKPSKFKWSDIGETLKYEYHHLKLPLVTDDGFASINISLNCLGIVIRNVVQCKEIYFSKRFDKKID